MAARAEPVTPTGRMRAWTLPQREQDQVRTTALWPRAATINRHVPDRRAWSPVLARTAPGDQRREDRGDPGDDAGHRGAAVVDRVLGKEEERHQEP